jgi:multicomponent K+:H+ antiporter subunit A
MAGVPLLNGFLSKEMFFAETLAIEGHPIARLIIPAVAALAAALSVAYSARFVHDVFFNGAPRNLPRDPHEPPLWMRLPVALLAVVCLLVGLLPGLTVGTLLDAGARDMLGREVPPYSLAIWHGFNVPLAMSMLAMAGGTALYFWLQRGAGTGWRQARGLHERDETVGLGQRGFHRVLNVAVRSAGHLDRMLNAGGVRRSLVLTVTVVALAVALPWWQTTGPLDGLAERPGAPGSGALWPLNLGSLNGWPLVLWLLAVAAAICTVALSRHRLAALLCMGIVGLVVSLVFVGLSAPDLALTQLLVEGVTLLLMMLALRYLPAQSGTTPERDARKLRDAALSAVTGLGLGAIAWAVMMRPFETRSAHYLERALPEAGGSNVVNVVIVDFRGFDTFGETMVMAAAGLVIHALLAGRTLHAVSGPSRAQAVSAQTQRPLLLAVLAWAVLPFALMVSVYFFLRGHNLPGGGFIAGLVTSIGLLLQQMAQGAHHTPDVSNVSDASARSARDTASHAIRRWHQCIGAGLLLAALTGLGSWLVGYPFLTSSFGHPVLPVLGELPIASAAAFDLGVYLTVVGATLLALTDLARLALPANRTAASATRQDAPGTAAVGGPH